MMRLPPILEFRILWPVPADAQPEEEVRVFVIKFQRLGLAYLGSDPYVYRCLECAAAGIETHFLQQGDSDTSELARHVKVHSEMARWYEARILNRKE